MSLFANVPGWIIEISDHLKTQEICNEAMLIGPCSLAYVPNHLQTQEMCDAAVRKDTYTLRYVPDHFMTQEICDEAHKIMLFGVCL